eukprot:3819809-Pyramimonas_sp.AAC.1
MASYQDIAAAVRHPSSINKVKIKTIARPSPRNSRERYASVTWCLLQLRFFPTVMRESRPPSGPAPRVTLSACDA